MMTSHLLIIKTSLKHLTITLLTLVPQSKPKSPRVNHPSNHILVIKTLILSRLTPCDAEEVAQIISTFANGKASGPFSIPTNLLKEFSQYLSKPISIIINKSLQEGVFPQSLKIALVCAIYKRMIKPMCQLQIYFASFKHQ